MRRTKAERKPKPERSVSVLIAKRRRELGMTQRDLADEVGVDKTTVSHWERGKSLPTGKRIPVVAKALLLTAGELFRGA